MEESGEIRNEWRSDGDGDGEMWSGDYGDGDGRRVILYERPTRPYLCGEEDLKLHLVSDTEYYIIIICGIPSEGRP